MGWRTIGKHFQKEERYGDEKQNVRTLTVLFYEFNYHESWGKLMEVVEKIGNHYSYEISKRYCRITVFDEDIRELVTANDTTIQSVYANVIQFILWHQEWKTPIKTDEKV